MSGRRAAEPSVSGRAPQRPALLLLVPLSIERAAIAGATADALVMRTGMGRRRARAAACRGRRIPAVAVGVAGFCGGLTGDLRPGDIVVATSLAADGGDPDYAVARASGPLVAALRARGLERVHTGQVVSSSRLVHGAERARLAARGALAVDMESAWLAGAAGGRPFAVLRVVVDTPATRLSHPLEAMRGYVRAQRVLRRAVPALVGWARAAGERRVLLASPRSFCAGAQRAIETVERALDLFGPPVYVRKQIVHNRHVVEELQRRGARFVDSLDQIPPAPTASSRPTASPRMSEERRPRTICG